MIPVKVAVRCKPCLDRELNKGCQTCIRIVPGEAQIVCKDKSFTSSVPRFVLFTMILKVNSFGLLCEETDTNCSLIIR